MNSYIMKYRILSPFNYFDEISYKDKYFRKYIYRFYIILLYYFDNFIQLGYVNRIGSFCIEYFNHYRKYKYIYIQPNIITFYDRFNHSYNDIYIWISEISNKDGSINPNVDYFRRLLKYNKYILP